MKNIFLSLLLTFLYTSSCNTTNEDLSSYLTALEENCLSCTKEIRNNCQSIKCAAFGDFLTANLFYDRTVYDSAFIYGHKALMNFKKIGLEKKVIETYWFLGDVLQTTENYNSSIKLYNKALGINKDLDLEMELNIDLARSYYYKSEIFKVKELLENSAKHFKGDKNKTSLYAKTQLLLGMNYTSYQVQSNSLNFHKSHEYFFEALSFFSDDNNLSKTLNNIGRVYLHEKQYDKAKVFLDSAYSIENKSDSKSLIAYNYGLLYKQKNDLTKSIKWFNKIISFKEIPFRTLNTAYNELIKLNIDLDRDDVAKNLSDKQTKAANFRANQIDEMKELSSLVLFNLAEGKEINHDLIKRNKQTHYLYVSLILVILGLLFFIGVKWIRPSVSRDLKVQKSIDERIRPLMNNK